MIEIERFEPFDDSLGYFELPKGKYPVARTFGMLVDGVGMSPRYLPDDLVIFCEMDEISNGADVAVKIGKGKIKLRQIQKVESGILLLPINPAVPTEYYSNEEIKSLPVEILGVAVEQRRNVKTAWKGKIQNEKAIF